MDTHNTARDAAGDALGMTGLPPAPVPPAGWLPVAWDAQDRRLICLQRMRNGGDRLLSWYGGPDYLPPVGLPGWGDWWQRFYDCR